MRKTLLHPTLRGLKPPNETHSTTQNQAERNNEYNLFTQAPLPNSQYLSSPPQLPKSKGLLPQYVKESSSTQPRKHNGSYDESDATSATKKARHSSYDLFADEHFEDDGANSSFRYSDYDDGYDQYDSSFDVSSLLPKSAKRNPTASSTTTATKTPFSQSVKPTQSNPTDAPAKSLNSPFGVYKRNAAPLLPTTALKQQQNTDPNSPLHSRAAPTALLTTAAAAQASSNKATFSSFARSKPPAAEMAVERPLVQAVHTQAVHSMQDEPPVVFDGTRLVPLCAVEASHRSVFGDYDYLNVVQSTCFNTVYKSDENCVVSAPTGCGKTVIFELAILRTFRRQIRRQCGVDAFYSEEPYVYDKDAYQASFLNATRTYNIANAAINPIFKNKKGETVMLADASNTAHAVAKRGENVKAIYICPLKALCEERYNDWRTKFTPLGIRVEMITGDTGGDANINMDNIDLVVTTPEKWDSMTRRWNATKSLNGSMDSIGLLLLDEVHVLGEDRGACLEGTVTRCKMVRDKHRCMLDGAPGACCGACDAAPMTTTPSSSTSSSSYSTSSSSANNFTSSLPPIPASVDPDSLAPIAHLRIVAVSATIPNVADIGKWAQARIFSFGKEYRPVPLQLVVRGYPPPQGNNSAYRFVTNLGYKVFDVLAEHSGGRPALIFCPTRKDCLDTATHIVEAAQQPDARRQLAGAFSASARDLGSALVQSRQQRERLEQAAQRLDPKLASLVRAGVGVHSAGLHYEHRLLMESLFRDGVLLALCTTSTLAQGVNLPAHLVVIKGTQQYIKGKGFVEYQPGHVIQMMGRAGRPQFDSVGKAVILTSSTMRAAYERLDERPVCSTLATQIGEHLNAELVLRTVRCQHEAQKWAINTYCHVTSKLRGRTGADFEKEVANELTRLREYGLVEDAGFGVLTDTSLDAAHQSKVACQCALLRSSALGEVAARFYLKVATTQHFVAAVNARTAEEFLDMLVQCEEYQNVEVRMGEKGILNALNKHAKKLHTGKQCAGQGDYFTLVAAGRELARSSGKDKDDGAIAATGVRYPLKRSQVTTASDKIRILLQCAFGEGKPPSHELVMDTETVRQGCARLSGALSEWLERRGVFAALKWSLLFRKAADAKMWAWQPDHFNTTSPGPSGNDDDKVANSWAPLLLQLDGIGSKYCEALAACSVRDFASLQALGPGLAEVRGIRDSSLWSKVQNGLRSVPEYRVDISGDPAATGSPEEEHWMWLKVTIHQCKEDWVSKHGYRGGAMILVGDYRNRLIGCHCWRPKSGAGSWTLRVRVRKGSMVTVDVIDKVWVGVDVGGQFTVPGTFVAESDDDTSETTSTATVGVDDDNDEAASDDTVVEDADAEQTDELRAPPPLQRERADDDNDDEDWSFGDVDPPLHDEDQNQQGTLDPTASHEPSSKTVDTAQKADSHKATALYKRLTKAPAAPNSSPAGPAGQPSAPLTHAEVVPSTSATAPVATPSATLTPFSTALSAQTPVATNGEPRRGLYNRRNTTPAAAAAKPGIAPAAQSNTTHTRATDPRPANAKARQSKSNGGSSNSSRASDHLTFAPAAKDQDGPLRAYLIRNNRDEQAANGSSHVETETSDSSLQASPPETRSADAPARPLSATPAPAALAPLMATSHVNNGSTSASNIYKRQNQSAKPADGPSQPSTNSTRGFSSTFSQQSGQSHDSGVASTNSWLQTFQPTTYTSSRSTLPQHHDQSSAQNTAAPSNKSKSANAQPKVTAGVALLSSLRQSNTETGVKRLPAGHIGSVLANGNLGTLSQRTNAAAVESWSDEREETLAPTRDLSYQAPMQRPTAYTDQWGVPSEDAYFTEPQPIMSVPPANPQFGMQQFNYANAPAQQHFSSQYAQHNMEPRDDQNYAPSDAHLNYPQQHSRPYGQYDPYAHARDQQLAAQRAHAQPQFYQSSSSFAPQSSYFPSQQQPALTTAPYFNAQKTAVAQPQHIPPNGYANNAAFATPRSQPAPNYGYANGTQQLMPSHTQPQPWTTLRVNVQPQLQSQQASPPGQDYTTPMHRPGLSPQPRPFPERRPFK